MFIKLFISAFCFIKDDVLLKLGEIRARRKDAMAKGKTLREMLHEEELDKPHYGRDRRRNVGVLQPADLSSLLPAVNIGTGEDEESGDVEDSTEGNMENIRALYLLNFSGVDNEDHVSDEQEEGGQDEIVEEDQQMFAE